MADWERGWGHKAFDSCLTHASSLDNAGTKPHNQIIRLYDASVLGQPGSVTCYRDFNMIG